MIFRILLAGFLVGISLQGCITPPPKPDYSQFFEHHPRSIVVVPASNTTTAVEAPVVFDTTVTRPLAERGYYVFPVFLTRDVLIDLGLSDEGVLAEASPQRFKDVFGADAILYVTIKEWVTSYIVISSSVRVTVHYKLVDTSSGTVLWEQTRTAVHQSGAGGGGNPIAALIVAAVDAAVTAGAVDYRPLAIQANTMAVNPKGVGIPAGPYHPDFRKDYPNYQ
ncbi:GNA1162 family protein [Nitrospira sp. M1]